MGRKLESQYLSPVEKVNWYSCNCKHPIPRKRYSNDEYYFVCKNCEYIIDWDYIELFGIDNLR